MNITVELVQELIDDQFPEFSDLEIRLVENCGNDNRTFHLGDTMAIRLPSGPLYASQIEKEIKWLPELKPHLSLSIPSPIVKGEACDKYPFNWSINQWLEGDTLDYDTIDDLNRLAIDLAGFLKELQSIDATLGPISGRHNFFRGGSLAVYDDETRDALLQLESVFDTKVLEGIWNTALQSKYENKPVWVHGDIAIGNLLVIDGKLSSILDFGILGTGDPACDYVMAWTFFEKESRQSFIDKLDCDKETLDRAKGWALWKALISYDIIDKKSDKSIWAQYCIDEIISEI